MNTVLEPRLGHMQPAGDSWLASDFRFPYPSAGGLESYQNLFNRFTESPQGVWQAEQEPRFYTDFGYEPAHMLRDLGQDVHPIDHMWYTYGMVTRLVTFEQLKYEQLGETPGEHLPRGRELVAVRLGALLHDIGECTHPSLTEAVGGTIGDIPFGRKTAAHKQTEAAIRGHLFQTYYADLPDWLLERCESLISHSEDSPSHNVTQVAHDIGAYTTSIRAGERWLRDRNHTPASDQRLDALSRLATQVSARAYESLEPWRDTYEIVDTLLGSTEPTLTAIHNAGKN
jgi:hypothetical protein